MHPPVRMSGLAGSARNRASSAPTAGTVASFRSPIRSFAGTSPADRPTFSCTVIPASSCGTASKPAICVFG